MRFDAKLETERMFLRPWTLLPPDREFFHFTMSDERIQHFYPGSRTREESDAFLEKLVANHEEHEIDWAVACLKGTGQPIGFTGITHVHFEADFCPAVEIGWKFDPAVWQLGYASEAARELLRHGFEDLELKEIVAFTAAINIPSTKVMQAIGMQRDRNADFDHPQITDPDSPLKAHILYRLSAADWQIQTER